MTQKLEYIDVNYTSQSNETAFALNSHKVYSKFDSLTNLDDLDN